MSMLSLFGVTQLVTEKIRWGYGKTLDSYDKTQENFFGSVDNGVTGIYNVVDDVVDKGAQIVYDGEVRAFSTVDNVVEKVATLLYDTLEIVSWVVMFMVIVVVIILIVFHQELFDFTHDISQLVVRIIGSRLV
jgi:hypothetical protein